MHYLFSEVPLRSVEQTEELCEQRNWRENEGNTSICLHIIGFCLQLFYDAVRTKETPHPKK